MNPLQINILQVMSTQSEDFLAKPDSSCFIAAGIEPPELIVDAMKELADNEYIDLYTDVEEIDVIKVEKDDDGNPLTNEDGSLKYVLNEDDEVQMETITHIHDHGFILTDKGKAALAA